MSGTTALDVILEPRLGPRMSARRQRVTVGSDVVVWLDVRNELTHALIPGAAGLAALYWLPGTRDDESAAQPLVPVEASPGTWQVLVPQAIPGTYVVWWMAAGRTAEIVFDVSSIGEVTLTSTGTPPWGDIQAVGAAAGVSAAGPEARRVGALAGAAAGAEAAPAAALEAIAPQVAQVDSDAMAAEMARQDAQAKAGIATDAATTATGAAGTATGAATTATGAAGTATNKAKEATDAAALATGAATNVDSRLPKAGGTMTGALTVQAPTSAAHAARKVDVDAATITLPHSNSITGRDIPATITSVFVQGFSAQGDGGESGPWVVVASQPSHTAWRQSSDGRIWELQTQAITARGFGCKGTGSDETAQITNMFAYAYAKFSGAYGAQWVQQPSIDFGPGRFRAPDLVFSSDKTCVTIKGAGPNTLLDGIRLDINGQRQQVNDLALMDSRGGTTNPYAIRLTNARNTTISRVIFRDRYVAIWLVSGLNFRMGLFQIEKCKIGIYASSQNGVFSGDGTFSNYYVGSCDLGYFNRGAGEVKLGTGHVSGNNNDVIYYGDERTNSLECYHTNSTWSNTTLNRTYPIIRVEDNGSGGARAIVAENVALSGAAAAPTATGTRFTRGFFYKPAEAKFTVSSATGSLTALTAGGVSLTSATVNWTAAASGATAIAAAINAGTASHGYSAEAKSSVVYVDAPGPFDGSAQNGIALSWSLGSGTLTGRSFVMITTAAAHGLLANDPAEFNSTGSGYNGIAGVAWVENDTSFAIDGTFTTFSAGNVTLALRAVRDQTSAATSGFTTRTTYNQSTLFIRNTGPGWIDIGTGSAGNPVAFTGTDTGSLRLPGYELILIGYDSVGTVNDIFVNAGNVNKALMTGVFGVSQIAERNKDYWWIDTAVFSSMQSSGIEKIGQLFGRTVSNNRAQIPSGASAGWALIGGWDSSGSFTPGSYGPALIAPYTLGGMVGGKARTLNIVHVLPDRISLAVGGTETAIGFAGVKLAGATFAELTSKYPAASYSGWTLRITDRGGRFATSDGTAWRDQTGAVMT